MSKKFEEVLEVIIRGEKIFSSPTRLAIMILLYLNTKMKFTTLQKALNLTPGNLSSHLRKLEAEGLIKIFKGFVNLRPTTIVQITEVGVEKLRNFANNLKKILEAIEEEKDEN